MNDVIRFTLYTTLPDLNAQLKKAKTSPYAYASMTKKAVEDVAFEIRAAFPGKVPKVTGPFSLILQWHVKDRRRDPDNIAFAIKYVLDGMQEAGIIENDGFKQVSGGVLHNFEVTPSNCRVDVFMLLNRSLYLDPEDL